MQKASIEYDSSCKKAKIHGDVYDLDANKKPVAMLQICHGMKEYMGRYENFARYMSNHGIIVFGNDHMGHGQSVSDESELGSFCVESSHGYLVDDAKKLADVMIDKHPDLPLFLLGHSMGSFVSRIYVGKYRELFDGLIMMGSANKSIAKLGRMLAQVMIFFNKSNYRKKSALLDKIMTAGYNKRIDNPTSKNSWISSDKNVVKAYDEDPLCNYNFKIGGYRDLFWMLECVSKNSWFESIDKNLPVFIVAGKEDPVGNYSGEIETIYEKLKNSGSIDLKIKLYDNARHEILNEKCKQHVYDDILEWIESRTKKLGIYERVKL